MYKVWRPAVAAIAVAALVGAGGCGFKRKKKQDEESGSAANATKKDQDEDRAPKNPFGNLDFFSSLLSNQLDKPGPYDEKRKSDGFSADSDHIAVLELSGPIVELKAFSLFSGMEGKELSAVEKKLDDLAADKHVKGLLIRAGEMAMSMAAAEELRAALIRFKGEGKRRLLCHTEQISNVSYYVLSACDSIGLAPTGMLMVSGTAAMPIHIKGLLDKLGLQPDFLHVGAFKGAAEPLTRDSPSPEMRQTLQAIIDRAYESMVTAIAEGRKLEPAAVEKLIDTAVFHDQDAVKAGLADAVAIFENYRDQNLDGAEWKVIRLKKLDKPDMTKLMRFVGLMPPARPWQPHVAVVHAVGSVIDGEGGGILGARQEIASHTLAAALRALAADDNVKAVVFRIDSGGGSALASELIWTAVAEVRAKKPVVVSMAGVAASGGYYIACGANKIYALDNTLTGSIGVVFGKLAIKGTLDKLGVTVHPMARGKRALMFSLLDPWTADERTTVMGTMEAVYKTFVDHVAAGRGKSYDDIHAIAQGRVWTGTDAKERGLVDEIGGLRAAIAEARKLGNVDEDVDLEIYPPEPTLMDIVNSFGSVQSPVGLEMQISEIVRGLARDLGFSEAKAVAGLLDQVLLLRDSNVLAVSFLPVVIK